MLELHTELMIKGFIKSFAIHIFVLWFVAKNVGGIEFGGNFQILAMGAVALTGADLLIKPLLNIFLLPFNLMTLGIFRWVSNVLTLYITTLVVSGFSVVAFTYPGFTSNLFIIPSIELSALGAYIVVSVITSFCVSLLFWVVK